MAWILLILAGLFEVVWAVGLKYTDGFTRFYPSAGTVLAMIFSVVLLAYAVRTLPMGTAYAIWTSIGVVGTVIYGICFFGEPLTILRLSCISVIILAVIGLKLSTH